MFPRINSKFVCTDKIKFRRRHYWIEAPRSLKHLRKPHEHNFSIQMKVQVIGDNREFPCETLNGLLFQVLSSIPRYFPWSCETLGKKTLQRMCRVFKENKETFPEFYDGMKNRSFILEINEGDTDQGVMLTGKFQE